MTFIQKKKFPFNREVSKTKTESPKTKKKINKKVSKILVKRSKIKSKHWNKEGTDKRSKTSMHSGKEVADHHHKIDTTLKGKEWTDKRKGSKHSGKQVADHHHKIDSMHKDKELLENYPEIDSTQLDKEVADKHHEIDSKQWDKEMIGDHSEIDLNQWYKEEGENLPKIESMPSTIIKVPRTTPHDEEHLPSPVKRVYTDLITPVESDYLKVQSLTESPYDEKIKKTLGRALELDHLKAVRKNKSKETIKDLT